MKRALWPMLVALSMLALPADAQWNPARPIRIVVLPARRRIGRGGADDQRTHEPEARPAGTGRESSRRRRHRRHGHRVSRRAGRLYVAVGRFRRDFDRPPSAAGFDQVQVRRVRRGRTGQSATTILVARPGLNVKNLGELLALAKTSKLSYSSWGNGSLGHVAGESFKSTAKIDLLNVPYQGAAPAAQAVLGGQVDLMFMPGPLWISFATA